MTRSGAVRAAAARLLAGGVDTPELDARVLAQEVFGVDHAALLASSVITATEQQLDKFSALVDRRLACEPTTRILQRREFWGLEFTLSPETLDPRPDSETIVEAALEAVRALDRPLKILDLGTGTGCLLLAVLSERPDAFGIGVDRSADAAATARRNARALGLGDRSAFVVGDWTSAIGGAFDLVLSNPPYIAGAEIETLEREVKDHDPWLALDGGADGLDAYRAILADVFRLIAPDATIVLELGQGQQRAVESIAVRSGLASRGVRIDLGGVPRALVLGVGGSGP